MEKAEGRTSHSPFDGVVAGDVFASFRKERSPGCRIPPPVVVAQAAAALALALERALAPPLPAGRSRPEAAPGVQVTTVESERFFALVIGDDGEGAIACIDALRGRGVSYDTVCSDLLVPAARRLGACWGDDTATFVEVTLGMRRLHESLRHLGDRAPCAESPVGLRALLVPAPGEQHTFGVAMVQASFRRAGWDVAGGIPDSAGEVGCSVRGEHFDVAGLSASRDDQVETVASCVRAVRRSSCNPAIVVMVGGRAFADNPMLVVRVGADAVAADAAEAPGAAARLVAGRQARSA